MQKKKNKLTIRINFIFCVKQRDISGIFGNYLYYFYIHSFFVKVVYASAIRIRNKKKD